MSVLYYPNSRASRQILLQRGDISLNPGPVGTCIHVYTCNNLLIYVCSTKYIVILVYENNKCSVRFDLMKNWHVSIRGRYLWNFR